MPEALIQQALARWNQVAVCDDSGALTYEQLLLRSRLLAAALGGDDSAVGLMLPASLAADVALVALLLLGKLPVLLNWTTGPANLAHAVSTMKLRRVITSKRFLDRLELKLDGVTLFFLEDFAAKVNKTAAAFELVKLRLLRAQLPSWMPKLDPDTPAVVLFTSGSEKAPKAVPLTHRNLLSNIRSGVEALEFQAQDALLGFLPPFHSFGLSGNILLPLLSGLPVAHHPDPTDSIGLIRKIKALRIRVLFATPTFFSYILNRAAPGELDSLRLVVTGAEKCPDNVFDLAAKLVPHTVIAEGYGITECSPVVSVNRPSRTRRGTIGQPLPGVELKVVDPETKQLLPQDTTGLLLVHGPNVFPGYLGHEGPSPFLELEGKRWYITGDLARVDATQTVTFAGRLKRFIKAGGEMISLPALEEVLARRYPPTDKGPQVAVEGIETEDGGRILVLFTVLPLTLREANDLLAEAGFRGIMRLDDVRRLAKIPLLGTGKTDFKVLRAEITANH